MSAADIADMASVVAVSAAVSRDARAGRIHCQRELGAVCSALMVLARKVTALGIAHQEMLGPSFWAKARLNTHDQIDAFLLLLRGDLSCMTTTERERIKHELRDLWRTFEEFLGAEIRAQILETIEEEGGKLMGRDAEKRKQRILAAARDLATDFVEYDRAEDEDVSQADLLEAFAEEEVTIDEIVDTFREGLIEELEIATSGEDDGDDGEGGADRPDRPVGFNVFHADVDG